MPRKGKGSKQGCIAICGWCPGTRAPVKCISEWRKKDHSNAPLTLWACVLHTEALRKFAYSWEEITQKT